MVKGEILASWDIESGVETEILRSRLRGKKGFVNVVVHNETVTLVGQEE